MTIKGKFRCTGIAPAPTDGALIATFRPEWDAPYQGVTTNDIHFLVNGSVYEANQTYTFDVTPSVLGPGGSPVDPDKPGGRVVVAETP